MDVLSGLETLFVVAAVSAVAPILAVLVPGQRIPQLILLILGGVLIGPEVLGLDVSPELELIANVGLGMVFLLAGFEIDPALILDRSGRLAVIAWASSLVIAGAVTGALTAVGYVTAFTAVALALTTTALGTVLPILREKGMLGGALARFFLGSGAVGELFPIIAIAVFHWRWSGVPFFIRTGKRLPVTQTELRLVFKRPPRLGFGLLGPHSEPNQLVVKLDPSTGIRLIVDARRADISAVGRIDLDMEFSEEGGEGATPYEVLLHAALAGDSTRFTRQDGVEETWRVMQPLLDAPPPVHPYAPGSWGPPQAERLTEQYGGWHGPWLAS